VTFIQIAGSGQTPNQWISNLSGTNLPVGSYVVMPFNPPSTATSNWGSGGTLTCPVRGYYTCAFTVQTPSVGSNRQVQIRLMRNGSETANPGTIEVGDFGNPGMWGLIYNAVFSPGETLQLQGMSWQGQSFSVGGGTHVITFVPTPIYRR
jgi:hypothetical protein